MLYQRGSTLTALGLGVGLMYFLDPDRGRRRRALVRDRASHAARVAMDAAGATRRDVAHRVSGAAARARGAFVRRPVADEVLTERVRAQLGRFVSHPHAVDVEATNGVVRVSGPILQQEAPRLLRAIERIRGVREVINALDEHKEPDVPALQASTARRGRQRDIWQRQWSPSTRLAMGTAAAALAGYGLSRRDKRGTVLAITGAGLFARAATNLDIGRLPGIGARRRVADARKTVTLDVPVN